MLIKEKNAVLTEMIHNLEGLEVKPWMELEYAKLIEQIESANKKYKLHDPDIIRWVKTYMPDALRGLKLQDASMLRPLVKGNVVGMWGRGTLKTTFTKIAATYEALSNEKEVIILLPNAVHQQIYSTMLSFIGMKEIQKEIRYKTKEKDIERVEFLNGGSITVTNLKGFSLRAEQMGHRATVKRKRKVRLFADDFDVIKASLQDKAMDDIFEAIGYKEGNYTILTTPLIRTENNVQVLSPLQQFVVRHEKNSEQFHYIHRPAREAVIESMQYNGALAHLPKNSVLAEMEANFNMNDISILLGE